MFLTTLKNIEKSGNYNQQITINKKCSSNEKKSKSCVTYELSPFIITKIFSYLETPKNYELVSRRFYICTTPYLYFNIFMNLASTDKSINIELTDLHVEIKRCNFKKNKIVQYFVPKDCMIKILSYLHPRDFAPCSLVSRKFYLLCSNIELYKPFFLNVIPSFIEQIQIKFPKAIYKDASIKERTPFNSATHTYSFTIPCESNDILTKIMILKKYIKVNCYDRFVKAKNDEDKLFWLRIGGNRGIEKCVYEHLDAYHHLKFGICQKEKIQELEDLLEYYCEIGSKVGITSWLRYFHQGKDTVELPIYSIWCHQATRKERLNYIDFIFEDSQSDSEEDDGQI